MPISAARRLSGWMQTARLPPRLLWKTLTWLPTTSEHLRPLSSVSIASGRSFCHLSKHSHTLLCCDAFFLSMGTVSGGNGDFCGDVLKLP